MYCCIQTLLVSTFQCFIQKNRSVIHAFISIGNLELGIETCFYNGMDDYTKMWLQLASIPNLPHLHCYITHHNKSILHYNTERRALPILVTLFLLSYTKVLLTVSNVLFSFTSCAVTHLPSNHTTLTNQVLLLDWFAASGESSFFWFISSG